MRVGTPLHDTRAMAQDLDKRLSKGTTATATLQAWCEEHSLSTGAITVICHHQGNAVALGQDVLEALKVLPGEPIVYRRVQLVRADVPLVEAENWFLPQRLLPRMNETLATTKLPFGQVIAPLAPSRRTLYRCFPSYALDQDGQQPPEVILEHTAVVISEGGVPLALVKERFRSELVSFSLPGECDSGDISRR